MGYQISVIRYQKAREQWPVASDQCPVIGRQERDNAETLRTRRNAEKNEDEEESSPQR
jgi:hypothetical protein